LALNLARPFSKHKMLGAVPSGQPFWTLSAGQLGKDIGSSPTGLSSSEAAKRLAALGQNVDVESARTGLLKAIFRRLLEPLSLILLVAGIVSVATGDAIGGTIIILILTISIGLDTIQEGHAVRAADILRKSVALKAEVRRDGAFVQIPVESVVRGDVVRIRAGDIIPADALVLESTAFTANEAGLTAGEASNAVFRGAVAQTGEAIALVAATGRETLFGGAAAILGQAEGVTPFQRDLRAYGLLTAKLTITLVLVVVTAHMLFGRPVLQSLLFAVALAVGLTPELLPMITTVTLSRGADRMAKRNVIVKRLSSIHDLGAMTILCTDKTGTLTSAEITLAQSLDASARQDPRAAMLGAIAAMLGGDRGALDAALVAASPKASALWTMNAHRVFDFNRRLGSVPRGQTALFSLPRARPRLSSPCAPSAITTERPSHSAKLLAPRQAKP
jgi:P-type Mg2+ transporter